MFEKVKENYGFLFAQFRLFNCFLRREKELSLSPDPLLVVVVLMMHNLLSYIAKESKFPVSISC